jgi:ribose/xylose/arabinose/galactoside ABC-type transport system permease subunit
VAGATARLLRRDHRTEPGSGGEGLVDMLFVPAILAALLLYLSISADGFLETDNLTNIILQGATLAIVAFGITFLILAAELDLSVGSGVALVSVVGALVMRDTGSVGLGVLAGIGSGVALGLVNGLVVTKLEVPSFIATLGTLVIAHGIALALTNGAVIGQLPSGIGSLASDKFLGLRWLVWLVVAAFVGLYLLQRKTTFGIKVMSVGGNREAARLSGINVDRVRLMCFVLTGATVGVAGIALTSRVESGQPNAGGLLALTAIAAVVVGGTSLNGGRGSVAKTLWGVLLLSVLDNGLDVKGVNADMKEAVIGAVFIAAASVDFIRSRLRRRAADVSPQIADDAAAQQPDDSRIKAPAT